jgi:hypothetical protein
MSNIKLENEVNFVQKNCKLYYALEGKSFKLTSIKIKKQIMQIERKRFEFDEMKIVMKNKKKMFQVADLREPKG